MADLSDLIDPGAIVAGAGCASKRALIQLFGDLAARSHGLAGEVVVDGLAARERLGSTGFGGGVAIPHARIAGLNRVVGLFAGLAEPLPFQAVDALPVDIAFALLSPPEAGADHLKALARVSRALRDPALVAKLRGAGSADAVYVLLAGDESRDAA